MKILKKLLIPLLLILGVLKLILDFMGKGSLKIVDKAREKDSELAKDISDLQNRADDLIKHADDLSAKRKTTKSDEDWHL